MYYVKLISKPDEYYDAGTEVFNYEGRRFTLDEFYDAINNALLCRGYVDGEIDGDLCLPDEFVFEIVEEIAYLDKEFDK